IVKFPYGSRLQPFRLLRRRGTHLPMVIDLHNSGNRIADSIRRRPVVLRCLAWVVTDYGNAFRGEHVIIDAHDELIVTAADRWHARPCRSFAVKCNTGISQDPAIGIAAIWQRQLNHVTHLRLTKTHGNGPNSSMACCIKYSRFVTTGFRSRLPEIPRLT